MNNASNRALSRWVGLTVFMATSALAAAPAQAWKARSTSGQQVTKKSVVRKGLQRMIRPLRPQQAPIKLNWTPKSPSDFNIIGLVKGFQAQVPKRIQRKMARASAKQLANAHSVSFTQRVDDGLGRGSKKAAVHITRSTVNMPLTSLLGKLPIEKWGVKLDHYLGGEVKVYKRDAKGRPVTQVERMVLSGLPGDLNIRALNMDMSKVEKKEVVRDSAGKVKKVTMFWRVHDSANRTTIMDVGSIAFEARGGKTLMTFHSAHRLGKNGIQLPNTLVKPTLRSFFSDHLRHYRELATAKP
jgi:hypothetical protein